MAFKDWIPFFSGLVSGAMGIGGTAKASSDAVKAVEKQNEGNLLLAQYAYDADLDMWNRQNDYNTPLNQMARLKDAGLNPNLMYGQGNTGNASSSPSFHAPQLAAYTSFQDYGATQAGLALQKGISDFYATQKTKAEIDNIRQNTQNLEANQESIRLKNIQQLYLNSTSRQEAEFYKDRMMAQLANMDSQSILHRSQSQYIDVQRFQFEALRPMVEQSMAIDLEQKLFDLNYISPAKLQNIKNDSAYKSAVSHLTNIKMLSAQLDLQLGQERSNYFSEQAFNENIRRRIEVETKQYEAKLKFIEANYGIKVGASATSMPTTIQYMTVQDEYNHRYQK